MRTHQYGRFQILAKLTAAAILLGLSGFALQYVFLEPADYPFVVQRDLYAQKQAWLLLHILAGVMALLLGGIQILTRFSPVHRTCHRVLGRVYGLAIVISAISALVLAPHAFGGRVSQLGFTALAFTWLMTTGLGIHAACQKRIAAHRRWMERSYAVTLSALSLRIMLGVGIYGLGFDFQDVYRFAAWASFISNLMILEALRHRVSPPSTWVSASRN